MKLHISITRKKKMIQMNSKDEFRAEQEKLKTELDNFERASEYKTKHMGMSILERLKIQVGNIDVFCPFCNQTQATESFTRKKCINCNRTFDIFPARETSRVADTAENRKKRLYIQQMYAMMKSGRNTIM